MGTYEQDLVVRFLECQLGYLKEELDPESLETIYIDLDQLDNIVDAVNRFLNCCFDVPEVIKGQELYAESGSDGIPLSVVEEFYTCYLESSILQVLTGGSTRSSVLDLNQDWDMDKVLYRHHRFNRDVVEAIKRRFNASPAYMTESGKVWEPSDRDPNADPDPEMDIMRWVRSVTVGSFRKDVVNMLSKFLPQQEEPEEMREDELEDEVKYWNDTFSSTWCQFTNGWDSASDIQPQLFD